MKKLIACAFNMDSGCVELKFRVERSGGHAKGVTR